MKPSPSGNAIVARLHGTLTVTLDGRTTRTVTDANHCWTETFFVRDDLTITVLDVAMRLNEKCDPR